MSQRRSYPFESCFAKYRRFFLRVRFFSISAVAKAGRSLSPQSLDLKQPAALNSPKNCAKSAQQNQKTYKRRTGTTTQFGLTHADATEYQIQPDENVFFFSNPFEREILQGVIDNILASVQATPRPILIIYCNSHSNGLIRKRTGFQLVLDCDFWGHHFTVFAN